MHAFKTGTEGKTGTAGSGHSAALVQAGGRSSKMDRRDHQCGIVSIGQLLVFPHFLHLLHLQMIIVAPISFHIVKLIAEDYKTAEEAA